MFWWWVGCLFGWGLFLFWAVRLSAVAASTRRLRLRDVVEKCPEPEKWPLLSVIVPARDEAPQIQQALKSLLESEYPNLQVVAIDDRSRDETGALMDSLAAENPRLKVVHVKELPEGWLGKNHAMHLGQLQADGEWILFTDGDIMFAPEALKSAIGYAIHENLDHLALFPHFIPGSFWENALMTFFSMVFLLGTRPGRVRSRDPGAYVGVGAFNLVRAVPYRAAGGHQRLALEVLDDVRLGQMMKDEGNSSGVLFSGELVSVRWQHSLWGMIRGLEKNGFAAFGYSVSRQLVLNLLFGVMCLGPYVGAVCFWGDPRSYGYLTAVIWLHVFFGFLGWKISGSKLVWLVYPIAFFLMQYTFWRSAVITVRQGGVRWRDTFYPMSELRKYRYRGPGTGSPIRECGI